MNLQLVVIVIGLLATIATSLWGMHMNNTRFAELKTELKGEVASLRSELKADIADLRRETKADIASLRTDVRNDIARLDNRLNGIQSDLNQFYVTIGKLEGRLDNIERRAA
jgi:chromosome segregation ATPase